MRGAFWSIALGMIAVLSWLAASAAGTRGLSAGGLLELYPWPEESVNLVENPSFEEVDGSAQVVGWTGGEPTHFSPTTDVARSGIRSVRLKDSHLAKHYPSMVQPLVLSPGWYTVRGWMKAEGAGTNAPGAGGRISVKWGEGWVSTPVVRETTGWTRVERGGFPILPGESAVLRLEAYRKPDGTVFFDDLEVRRQLPPVVEGFLLYPNYRGVLFEDRSQIIRMSVTVRAEDAHARLSDLAVRLSLSKEGEDGAVVAVEETPTTPVFLMRLDATAVPAGVYVLRLRVLRRGTEAVVFEYAPYRIVKLPVTARERMRVSIDQDNVLVLGGQRRFPLGIYDTGGVPTDAKIAKMAEAPLDLYLNYWLGSVPANRLATMGSRLRRHGLWFVHAIWGWNEEYPEWVKRGDTMTCENQTARALGAKRFTACMARALSEAPGFAGWYTMDEQSAGEVGRVFQQYDVLRTHHPAGITFLVSNRPRELGRWRDAADVIGVDPYAVYNVPADQMAPLEMVTNWVDQAQKASEKSRPVWAVIQFFQGTARSRWPTYDELRSMSYMAIAAGAKGLFYWSYGAKGLSWVKDPQRKEELWQRLVKVTKEIKSLEPALLSPDAPDVLPRYSPNGAIRILSKRVGDVRYVIAVNNTPHETQVAFTLSEPAGTVDVVGEGRTIPLNALNSFADRFAPYATHVYKIPGPTAK